MVLLQRWRQVGEDEGRHFLRQGSGHGENHWRRHRLLDPPQSSAHHPCQSPARSCRRSRRDPTPQRPFSFPFLSPLSEMGHASFIRSVLETPLNHFPEVLLLGMAHVNTAYDLIQNEVASVVLPMALKSAFASGLLFTMWHFNPNMLLRGLVDAANLDPDSFPRILVACQEIKILSQVMDMFPFYFGIRLAVLASKKEIVDLESWLSTQLVANKDAFYEFSTRILFKK